MNHSLTAGTTDAGAVARGQATRLFAFAHQMLGNAPAAAELAGRIVEEASRRPSPFGSESSARAWLYRVTANAALAAKQTRHSAHEGAWGTPGPSDALACHDVADDAYRLLSLSGGGDWLDDDEVCRLLGLTPADVTGSPC